jgi:hypothetical protein
MVADINNLRVKDNDNLFVIALKLVCRFNGITICNFVYLNPTTSFKTQKNFLSSFIKIGKTFFSHQNSQENFLSHLNSQGKRMGKFMKKPKRKAGPHPRDLVTKLLFFAKIGI